MKSLLNKMLNGRLNRWGFLAVLLLAAGATVAGMKDRQYRLGGAFIASDGKLVYNCVQSPYDPEGQRAALVVRIVHDDGSLAALLAAFGANTSCEGVGEDVMISHDTAKWNMIAYAQAAGPPLQTKAIFVYSGTLKFTDRDNFVTNYTLNVYPVDVPGLPNADANHDGFPDAGATPALTIPGLTGTGKRVPTPPPVCGN